jgi:hypothetical protein
VRPDGEAKPLHRPAQECVAPIGQSAEPAHRSRGHHGVAEAISQPFGLSDPCPCDALSHPSRALARHTCGEIAVGNGREEELQVKPVQQRTGEAPQIGMSGGGRARARLQGRAQVSARAGVGRRDKLGPCWKEVGPVAAGDLDDPLLQRLPEALQDVPTKLGQFIQEEDTPVGEG